MHYVRDASKAKKSIKAAVNAKKKTKIAALAK
jgi:hypothetical protein